jgi:hypothetical protein
MTMAEKKTEAVLEVRLCVKCKSYAGKMRAYGPYHECRHAQSKDLVEGAGLAACVQMRATLCGADGKLFEPIAAAKT